VWTEYVSELQLDEREPTTGVPRLLFDWFGELAPPLKPMILEKTTANAVRMRWLERALPGAAFIGIIRNGYAVVEGIRRKGGKSVARGARHWRLVNEMMLSDAKQVRNFLLVRYEDLVAAPQQTLSGISEFLDLKSNAIWTAFQNGDANLTEDSRMSFVDMNAQSISRLDESELRVITHEAGELLARMRVAIRKSIPSSPEPGYKVDGLEVDFEHRRVVAQEKEVQLTPTEYDLLRLLVTHAGKVLTHNQILRQLWGPAYVEQPHLLRVNISNLRRKIEPEPNRPRYILTELGVGYRFKMNS
jgi:hypothetical protein